MKPRLYLPVAAIAVLAVIVGAVLVLGPKSGDTDDDRPRARHVVVITLDSLRADALPCYGNRRIETPTLSRFADENIVFERAYAPSPWTRPSIASLLTGLPPDVHGFTERQLEREATTGDGVQWIAEVMTDAGYRTGAIGYNPFLANSPALRRGFRDFTFYPRLDREGEEREPADPTRTITDHATKWIEQHANGSFFLWLHYFDPHLPYSPPRRFYHPVAGGPTFESDKKYGGFLYNTYRRFLTTMWDLRSRGKSAAARERAIGKNPPKLLTEADAPVVHGLYEDEIRYVDTAIAEILQQLDRLGILEESLIIVTSDHGEEFWEHDDVYHGHTLYEEQIRVPLIIKAPKGRAPARRVASRVSLLSVMPTIVELCGLPSLVGQTASPSLAASLRDGTPLDEDVALFASSNVHGEPLTAVIIGDHKLIRGTETGREHLYDLARDPAERNDLVESRPDVLPVARKHLDQYDAWTKQVRSALKIQATERQAPDEEMRKLLRQHGYLR